MINSKIKFSNPLEYSQAKYFFHALLLLLLGFLFTASITAQQKHVTEIDIDAGKMGDLINKNIYGQFSEHLGHCIYGGIWVGENSTIPNTRGIRNDVVEALKKINVPVLRWPGGCFADEYHWMDGIGSRSKRPKMVNTNWGGVVEDNSFGTHEFLDFCSMIGAEPYITGNVGSGTVEELSKWIEYTTSDGDNPMSALRRSNGRIKPWKISYWGIGNESWGCGGNMRPEYYADLVRRYTSFCKNYGDNRIFKIVTGPNSDDYNWTDVLMKQASQYFDGIALHNYTWANSKPAADFDEAGWFDVMNKTLHMNELIEKHSAIMDKYDHDKRIALVVDEWGTWLGVEPGTNPSFLYQQNTLRDAVAAATNLNIFNNHCDRVRMANIAQMINVLQAMILTKDDKIVLTPTYYVFKLFKVHQNAVLLSSKIKTSNYIFNNDTIPDINCSASVNQSGLIHVSLTNLNPDSNEKINLKLTNFKPAKVSAEILTSEKMNDLNSFDNPNNVAAAEFTDFDLTDDKLEINMPSKSVLVFELNGELNSVVGAASDLSNPKPGLEYEYFEGHFDHLPNFDSLKQVSKNFIDQFKLPSINSGANFAVKYLGYIKIPYDGNYTFYTNSDDGTKLFIDDQPIVNNDGNHAPIERSGFAYLKKGFHKIKVEFYQAGGGLSLDVSIEGPNLTKQIIPAGLLFNESKK